MTARLDPFAPMRPELRARLFAEHRVAGKGGQFAEGGGRVPGRGPTLDVATRTRVGAPEWRASRAHPTTMVALLPRDGSWCRQSDPHVTLVYAGELAPDSDVVKRLLEWCRDAARRTPVLTVPVAGVEVFGPAGDRVDVLELKPTPELAELRADVEWANASEYTDYRPHATVGPEGSADAEVPPRLVLNRLWLVTGEDEWTWLLGGSETRTGEDRAAGKGGQFAPGGGRVPGRTVPARTDAFHEEVVDGRTVVTKGQVDVPDDPARVDLDKVGVRLLQMEISKNGGGSPELEAAAAAVDSGEGAFSADSIWGAHTAYIGAHYSDMNVAARSGQDNARVAALDRGFVPPPARALDRTVYRGVDNDTFGPTLVTGERFRDDGFVSTSESGGTASGFSGQLSGLSPMSGYPTHRTLYRITPATQAPCIPGNLAEHEWVLPRHSTFTVAKVQQYQAADGSVRRVVDLTWDGVEPPGEARSAARRKGEEPEMGSTAERFAWHEGDVVRLSSSRSASGLETRVYGKGGQFAKGGGRVPGRGGGSGGGGLSEEQIADFMTAAGRSARDHLEPDGQGGLRFTAERAALHERILAEAMTGVQTGLADPQFVILGGGPGAGKSTTSTAVGVPPPPDKGGGAAWADPDGMKQRLPEYDPKNPGVVHEESSYLAKRLTERALAARADVVIDGVGDNVGSVSSKVAGARAAGYTRVRAAYTTVEIDVAQERNRQRARSVPAKMLAEKHAKVSRNFESIAGLDFDEVQLWYNPQGGSAVQVAFKTQAGSALTVSDPAQWAAFLAKA